MFQTKFIGTTDKIAILNMLFDGGKVTQELATVTTSFRSRISDLRREGFCIGSKRITKRSYLYSIIPKR